MIKKKSWVDQYPKGTDLVQKNLMSENKKKDLEKNDPLFFAYYFL